MLKKLSSVLIGYTMLGVVGSGSAAAQSGPQSCSGTISVEEAQRGEDARYVAQTANDFATMEKLFGDDLVYIHSSAVVDGKASYIDSMRSGNVKYRVMRRSDVNVRTYGCLAIMTGNADFDVTVKGQEMSVALRFTSIWAKRGDGVQFVGWQATRIPPKQ
ncbi:MAG TPA: nuclear transport factor 2 family protein [Burkholderiales bacterium]|nr:nuclear transport factor 2 family protein [Burkholderiales bacterium]